MSRKSLSNLVWTSGNTTVEFKSMMTLTYGLEYPVSGRDVKRHFNTFTTTFRRKVGPYDYLWVLEFQERGAPHLHVLTTIEIPDYDYIIRDDMAHAWARAVLGKRMAEYCDLGSFKTRSLYSQMMSVHKHPDALVALYSADGALRYAIKYAAKLQQKIVPEGYLHVGRFWGASRNVSRSVRPIVQMPVSGQKDVRNALREIGRDDLLEWPIIPSKVLNYLG